MMSAPDDLALLIASVDRFARRDIDARRIDQAQRIPAEVLRGLADLGVFGITIPEAYGGAGLGLPAACRAVKTLARHDRAVATTLGLHLGLGTRALVAFAGDDLRDRYLPGLARGERLAAFAATEAGAGSDLAAIATTGREIASGRLRLDGTKAFVTNGGIADVFTVTAATPGLGGTRRGHSLVVVERGDAGVTVGREEHKLGLRGSSTTSLVLDGVEVPAGRIVGEPGQGDRQLAHILSWGRTVMAAGCVGAGEAALAATLEHVDRRRQFGRPLAALEVVKEQIALMAATAFAMDALVDAACAAADANASALLSIAAKVLCSEGDWEICDLALQLHGGAGFIESSGLPLLLRDARVTRIFEGANDVLLTHLGTLEATAPRHRLSYADGVAPLTELVAGRRDELVARHGARLLGRRRLLHQLGRAVVLREASAAAMAAARDDGERRLAGCWLHIARARAIALLSPEPVSEDLLDAVAGDLHARRSS